MLVICFLLISVLIGLSSAIFLRSLTESRIAQHFSQSSSAFWIAEAGIQRTIWELNSNSCTGFTSSTGTACTSCSNCGTGNKTLAASLTSYGDYDLTLNSGNTLVTATGSYPDRSSVKKSTRALQATLSSGSLFTSAVYAQGNISFGKNLLVDSYNSASGAYGGSNINTNGDVGSNGTASGTITIDKDSTIKGDVSTGVSGTVTSGSNVTITGSTTHTNNVSLPSVTVPSSLTGLSSSGSYSVADNSTGLISSGSYKYSDISLGKNAILTITGNVTMYLTSAAALSAQKDVQISVASGGSLTIYTDGVIDLSKDATINNTTQDPSKFIIYSSYSSASGTGVDFSKSGDFFGVIYCPDSNVNFKKSGNIYGSIVGKTVSMDKDQNIHYDETLNNISGGSGYSTSAWQET